jgi:putative oxidoreductase
MTRPRWGCPTFERAAIFYARVALGAAFLSAVAGRFGIWQGQPGMAKFAGFLHRTAEVNAFMPQEAIPFLAWASTVAETVLGLSLIIGFRLRWAAIGSATLLALFGIAMTISLGIKAPLDSSVFSASAAALLIALYETKQPMDV